MSITVSYLINDVGLLQETSIYTVLGVEPRCPGKPVVPEYMFLPVAFQGICLVVLLFSALG